MVSITSLTAETVAAGLRASTVEHEQECPSGNPLALTAFFLPCMRVLFGILILVEMLLIAAPFIASGIDRPETARAWNEWRQNPNPETEAAWKAESALLWRMNMVADLVLIALLGVNSVALFKVGRRVFRRTRLSRQQYGTRST
jgi:hypothetical protein